MRPLFRPHQTRASSGLRPWREWRGLWPRRSSRPPARSGLGRETGRTRPSRAGRQRGGARPWPRAARAWGRGGGSWFGSTSVCLFRWGAGRAVRASEGLAAPIVSRAPRRSLADEPPMKRRPCRRAGPGAVHAAPTYRRRSMEPPSAPSSPRGPRQLDARREAASPIAREARLGVLGELGVQMDQRRDADACRRDAGATCLLPAPASQSICVNLCHLWIKTTNTRTHAGKSAAPTRAPWTASPHPAMQSPP
jgi:hypothetical protein